MIGVFDSGIGGLNILKELTKLLPDYTFVYYADSIHNPYGEKSDEKLMSICSYIIRFLRSMDCKIIVIACNTATTRCMKKLREKYKDLIFVGTVPAIKMACDQNFKHTLVLATPATIQSERTEELVRDNKKSEQEIYLLPCYGLANAIEKNNKEEINRILDEIYNKYKDIEIDSIVLGCTHYPNIKEEIQERFPKATLLDGSLGVANEVKRQVQLNNIEAEDKFVSGNVLYFDSEDERDFFY